MEAKTGQKLRQARQARELSLEQVSKATRIRVHYLQALESDDFEAVPSITQARGFLRAYASYLDLDAEALLESMDSSPAPAAPEAMEKEEPAVPPAEETPALSEEADSIFRDVGQRLKHQRELLGLSLEDVERHTHLRRRYLEALEGGNLAGLPSPVQGRGMLKNYAVFLGLNSEAILLRFADGLQARLSAMQAARPPKPAEPTRRRRPLPVPLRRLLSSDILIGGTLAVFLVLFSIWGAIRIFAMRAESAPSPTAPSIAEVLLATENATASPTPLPATPTPGAAFPAGNPAAGTLQSSGTAQFLPPVEGNQPVQIYITVLERAWMRVMVDGKVEFEGRVIPGSAYSFSGEKSVELLTGNGEALQVFYNQSDLGLMGLFGQVVNRIFTAEGVLTPTPTITPTTSPTPRSTATPRPTATPPPGQVTVPALP